MENVRLDPEKITHPFQLMAAWFAMLVILVGILLTAAVNLTSPPWASAFLVISSVVLALIVMAAVYRMLTKYRPHLQGAKEYAEWLSDERRYIGSTVKQTVIKNVKLQQLISSPLISEDTSKVPLSQVVAAYPISISNLEGIEIILARLRELGFQAEVNERNYETYENKERHSSIWLGSRVPPHVAIIVMKAVISIWPHLRYLHLSGDIGDNPPDNVHNQIYIGGATSTAVKWGLRQWKSEEIEAFREDMSPEEFGNAIRSHYGIDY